MPTDNNNDMVRIDPENDPLLKTNSIPVEEENIKCEGCQGIISESERLTGFNGEDYCEDCYEERHYECESCCDFYPIDDVYTNNGETYCDDCYHEIFTYCQSCDTTINRDYAMWSETHEEYYCEDCYPGEGEDVDLDSYGNVDLHESKCFNRNKFSRAVGLELEAVHEDYEAMDYSYYERNWEFRNNWRVVHDGSIDSGDGVGREFITRGGLSGDELYQSIDNITTDLKRIGWSVNRSCGMHIHIDARDLKWREIKYILAVSKLSEQIIYKMLPDSRRNSRWCKRIPMTMGHIMDICDDQDFIDTWYQAFDTYPSYEKYNDARYCGVNMHSRIIHGSIEFRHHSGTLDSKKIINWIEICQRIVEAGIKLARLDRGNITTFNEYKKTYALSQYIEKSKTSMTPLAVDEFFHLLEVDIDLRAYIVKRILKFYNPEIVGEYTEIGINI